MGKTRISNLTPPRAGLVFAGLIGLSSVAFSSGAYADTVGTSSQHLGARLQTNSVSISTNGAINIDLVPSSTGTLAVGKSVVTVSTTANGGYQLYVSGLNAEPDGKMALYYNGRSEGASKLTGITAENPSAFTDANQWGFAIGDDANAYGFSRTNAYENASKAGSIVDRSTINDLKWQSFGKELRLINASTSSDPTNIYYGVYVNTDTMTGNYQNSVIYTAFADSANKLEVYPMAIKDGETMTVTAEYQSTERPITNTNQIAISFLDDSTSIGTCDNLAITNNGSTGLLEFTCQVHTNPNFIAGKLNDVAVELSFEGREDKLSYRIDDAWGNSLSLAEFENMQDATAVACKNSPLHSVYHLKDSRTNASYLVTKMADGNCWMTQNLHFPAGTRDIITQNGNTYDLGTNNNTTDWNKSITIGEHWYDGGTNGHIDNTPDANNNTGSRFSWVSATAGTGGAYGTSKAATDSICPQGWKLPTGGSDGDFDRLYTTTYSGNYVDFNARWSGAIIGYCMSNNCTFNHDINTLWWSATQVNSGSSYNVALTSSSFSSANGGYKSDGSSVRCMLETANTMQAFTQSDADAMETDTTITLKDTRDGKSYLISKMRDNNVWMTQNLAIEPGTNLTPANSNISTTYTIPSTATFSSDTAQDAIVPSHIDATPDDKDNNTGGYYSWNASTVTSVKMSSTSPVICGVITTCPNEIDNPSAKLAGERAKIVREKLTTNETIAGTLSLITAPNSAEVIHYWTLKAEFA